MKQLKMTALLFLIVLPFTLPVPVAANSFSIRMNIDYSERDMELSTLSSTSPFSDYNFQELTDDVEYEQRQNLIYLSGRWQFNPYFGLEAMLGYSDLHFEQDYKGDSSRYDDVTLNGDQNDKFFYGLSLFFNYPFSNKYSLGLTLTGQQGKISDDVPNFGSPLRDGEANNAAWISHVRWEQDIDWWSITIFPHFDIYFDNITLYTGPVYSMADTEIESQVIRTDALGFNASQTYEFEQGDDFGARFGAVLRMTENWRAKIEFQAIDKIGFSGSVFYMF